MLLNLYEDSSFSKSQQLENTIKVQWHQQHPFDQEINTLIQKISQMERKYIAMEKQYSHKIRQLYSDIEQKNNEFQQLKTKALQIKIDTDTQRKKAEELKKKNIKIQKIQTKAKSTSPVNSGKAKKKNIPNQELKSCSPKNSTKKFPSANLQATKKKIPKKIKLTDNNFPISQKNIQTIQKINKKTGSIKYLYQNQQDQIKDIKNDELSKTKKFSTRNTNFREKQFVFKSL